MTSTRSKSKSRQKCKRRRQNSASKRNRGQTKAVLKPERKKFNIHVPEGENLRVNLIKATSEERQQHYTFGLYDDIHVQRVEDSEDDVEPDPLIRTPRVNKKHQVVASNILDIRTEGRIAKIANFDADPGMESMHLNSSNGKHITASFDQNVGEAFEKQDNLSKIDDHTVTNVQSSSKNSKASGHVSEMLMKLAESGSKTEVFEVEVQPLDEGYRKKQKISSRIKDCNEEPDKQTRSETSLYLEDDDIIFSEEDLRHMDESAEKKCVQFQKLSSQVQFVFRIKIE
ncbi:Uncharacterized protein Fot_25302 [Forsythia ovata]|uniref:Uncharacterized protein n=1 Tax=Forsythia ovata TaxID=205694 RepID=A0ABD1U8Q3_9LAMI